MDTLVERCAGIDVGKRDVKACVRVPNASGRGRRQEVRTFRATTPGLCELRAWLEEHKVTRVGMESTGVYWKPVFYLLEDVMECWLINPQHMKNVPGRKSDVSDAAWIARLVEHGLVRPSFVPPQPIRALRDLTRYRTTLTRERAREAQRLHALLEDAGIKLAMVASDILGMSGRDMIAGLIDAAESVPAGPDRSGAQTPGLADPAALADLARGRMRSKIAPLTEALTGRFTRHHALLARIMLERVDQLTATINQLDAQLETEMEPFRRQVAQLLTIPGVGLHAAQVIIAETGADMSRFPTAACLASWAALCPGNNESAGRHLGGKTRHGNSWLRGVLGEAALSAGRTNNTFLGDRYRKLARRRGKRRALVATAHAILETVWHLLTRGTDYHDLGAGYHDARVKNPERLIQRHVSELTRLGFEVNLRPAPAP